MKVLITGGLGFIGSNLAERCLEEGHDVALVSKSDKKRKNIKGLEDKVDLILKDVTQIDEEVKSIDYIFHLASIVHNKPVSNDPLKEVSVNCEGTIALLEACRRHNPSARIVYGSTFFVNGSLGPEDIPANPSSPCNPLSIYAATRLAGEHFCKVYNNAFGMNSVIARFTNIFGIREQGDNREKGVLNRMISMAMKGGEILVYDGGEVRRDYLYVSDAVEACLVIAEKGQTGEIYYVGRGEEVKIKDLVSRVLDQTGTDSMKVVSSNIPREMAVGDFSCDNTPLRDLGWLPKVYIMEGIKKTIEWYTNE